MRTLALASVFATTLLTAAERGEDSVIHRFENVDPTQTIAGHAVRFDLVDGGAVDWSGTDPERPVGTWKPTADGVWTLRAFDRELIVRRAVDGWRVEVDGRSIPVQRVAGKGQ